MKVVGVDGVGPRWVAVVLEDGRVERVVDVARLVDLPALFPDARAFGVDTPMRLEEGRYREVDALLRRRPGVPPSSVFAAPPRVLLTLSYERALAHCRAHGLAGLSKQAHGLREKILDAERVLAAHPALAFFEVHPEASFAAMNGGRALGAGKKTWNGAMTRRALLAERGLVIPDRLEAALVRAAVDDVLDAAACAWSAHRFARGEHETIRADGQHGYVVV